MAGPRAAELRLQGVPRWVTWQRRVGEQGATGGRTPGGASPAFSWERAPLQRSPAWESPWRGLLATGRQQDRIPGETGTERPPQGTGPVRWDGPHQPLTKPPKAEARGPVAQGPGRQVEPLTGTQDQKAILGPKHTPAAALKAVCPQLPPESQSQADPGHHGPTLGPKSGHGPASILLWALWGPAPQTPRSWVPQTRSEWVLPLHRAGARVEPGRHFPGDSSAGTASGQLCT